MLQKGEATPQLEQWFDRLAPVVKEARTTLRRLKPGKLALRSGCERDEDGNFSLTFFWQECIISGDDFTVRWGDTGAELSSFTQSLVLTYLATADGTTPSSRWIGFRELPDGMFYVQAFQGYTGDRLVRELQGFTASAQPSGGVELFRRAAEVLGGEPLALGGAGYVFTVLPRVHMPIVYWEGDEEFPSQARVLFEDTAAHYMPTDGLAILGSQLVGRVLKTVR